MDLSFLGGQVTRTKLGHLWQGGGSSVQTYAEILRDDYGASEIWPLVDISAGTTINAFVDSSRNGTLTGWDLQNAAGPVSGTLAPYSDGVNDHGNVYTSNGSDGLADIYTMTIGSVFAWGKVANAGTWTDSTVRYLESIGAGAGKDRFQLFKNNASNQVRAIISIGGVTKTIISGTISTTDWFSMGASWKDTNNGDEVKAFLNGSQFGSTETGMGAATDSLGSLLAAIGSLNGTVANNPWSGWLAYVAVKFGSIWSPTDFANMHAAVSTAGAD